ncbi:hypothetical protein GCM10017667_72200 [Streptomyces filamentosus]|uniref:Ankyrin n=1 Tax=Streptomyces filamentosus TaxID=67294 RepID=A0A919BWI2_STRFL|nr:hypothetical protein GCM10017667_72200 [Streptomyces filamentosus]
MKPFPWRARLRAGLRGGVAVYVRAGSRTAVHALCRPILPRRTPVPPADLKLRAAVRADDAGAVRAALAGGAGPEHRDEHGRTPLLIASAEDRVAAAAALVAAGADPNARDDREDTPWLVTGVTGSVAMMRVLLTAVPAPDVTLTNRFGGTSLIPAAERGHADYVRAVLRATDIDVDHVNRLGWTALLEAVILGGGGPAHQEVVELLISAGAAPHLPDRDGVTPLRHARRRGLDEIAGLLAAVR